MVPESFLRKPCGCDDWEQMECDADRQMSLPEGVQCKWFAKASAFQAAHRLASIELTPLRNLVERKKDV